MRLFKRWIASLALAAAVPLALALDQNYPDRVIKLVLPFPPGSATDGVSRFIADELRKGIGQNVIIENQAGADGIVAAQAVKRAVPDVSRLQLLPNVPTTAEAGHKSVAVVSFAAVFAPAKTDPAIVDRLNREINKVLATAHAREFIHKIGATSMVMTPSELRSFVSGEIVHWAKLVEMAGIPKK